MRPQPGFTPHVSTLGQGARRALALHCTMAFGGAWAGVSKALGPQMTLVAPDMPSHGQSADWDEVSDFGDTVYAASAALLDAGPMDVIGHSFGAAIALRLAVDFPDRIRSLTLFEPVLFLFALADAPETMVDTESRAKPFTDALLAGNRREGARLFNRMWSTGPVWDSLPERARAAMARAIHVVPDTHAFLYNDTAGFLEEGVLAKVQMPTLVMRGDLALPAVKATNAGLARRLGNAMEVVIPGAGHMAPISHPAEVAEAISEVLRRSA